MGSSKKKQRKGMMENHETKVTEIKVDSLTEKDIDLTAPAVEPTMGEQEEHDASFGSEDSDSAEMIEDAQAEAEVLEDSVEEEVEENPTTEEQAKSTSLVDAVAEKVLSIWKSKHADSETLIGEQGEAQV